MNKILSWLMRRDGADEAAGENDFDAAEAKKDIPLAQPAYYEVWGHLETTNRALWLASWACATVAMLALLLLRLVIQRPPVVISVNGAGQAVAADAARPPAVSEAEVKNFLALFEKFFIELNVHSYEDSLRLAATMMTPEGQAKADEFLKQKGIVEELKAKEGRIKVFLGELKIAKDTPEVYECVIKGSRELESYKQDAGRSVVLFEHNIILKKVPRSEKTPYGILVGSFSETPLGVKDR